MCIDCINFIFLFKQKTAYEMRISDWSSDVCSSDLTQPGNPTQNAYVESFNGKFRDECLNENWSISLEHARAVIAIWRKDYNEVRPHSSLPKCTPAEFAAALRNEGSLAGSTADQIGRASCRERVCK